MRTEQLDRPNVSTTPADPFITGATRGAGLPVKAAVVGVVAATIAVIAGAVLIFGLVTGGAVEVDVPALDVVDGPEIITSTNPFTAGLASDSLPVHVAGYVDALNGRFDGAETITSTNPFTN